MTPRAVYTVLELAELMGWCDRSSSRRTRHSACKRMLRLLRSRGVHLVPVGTGRQHLVPLGSFASAMPAVWAGVVAMWRTSGVRIPTSIPCAGCGTEVPVPPVSHLGHGGTRRDIATP